MLKHSCHFGDTYWQKAEIILDLKTKGWVKPPLWSAFPSFPYLSLVKFLLDFENKYFFSLFKNLQFTENFQKVLFTYFFNKNE